MASEFDKKLNERFDDASLGELMPGFDTASEWKRIEQQLPKKNRIIPVLWLSHAAAIAVGLLISWGLMKQWMGNENSMQQSPAVVYEHTDTPAKTIQAMEPVMAEKTVAAGKTKTVPTVKESKATKRKAIERIPRAIEEPEQEEPQVAIQEQEEQEEPTVPKPEPVIAASPKPGVQAVHLLDINNEDKQIMIKGDDPKLQYKDPIARLLSPSRLPENGNGNPDRPLPIRGFFEK